MQGMLHGKVAVITGAGSGVGRAAVLLFCRHGAKVIAADIDFAAAGQSVALAEAEGGVARAIACDVTKEAEVEAAVALAVAAFGRLDILYNNAGITASVGAGGSGVRTILDMSEAQLASVQAVNVNGVIYGCRAAIRRFVAQGGGGAIVSTASIAGLIGFGGAAYATTKGGIVAMTRTLAMEWGAHGIRVNAVCPAGMFTHFGGMDPEGENADRIRQNMGALYPLDHAVDPEHCAAAAMFLASDLAGSITGVNLPVDCGLSAGVKQKPRG